MSFEIISCSEIRPAEITRSEVKIVPADGPFVPGFFDQVPETQYRAAWEKIVSAPGLSLDKLYKEFVSLNQLYGAVDASTEASTEASEQIDGMVQRALKDVKEIYPEVCGLQNEYLMGDGGLMKDLLDLTATSEKPGDRYRLGCLVAQVENSIKVLVKYHGLLHFLLGRGVIAWPPQLFGICMYYEQATNTEEPAVQVDSSGFRLDPDAICKIASQLCVIDQYIGSALLAMDASPSS